MILTSTAGNTTCFTKKKIGLDLIPDEFKSEQYAVATLENNEVTVDMYGGEFSGGGAIAGCLFSDDRFVEVNCSDMSIVCEKRENSLVKAFFPKSLIEVVTQIEKDLFRVEMVGITHYVTKNKGLLENGSYLEIVEKEDALATGVILVKDNFIFPKLYVKGIEEGVVEGSCTSGSIAVNETLGLVEMIQPSGEILQVRKNAQFEVKASCRILKQNLD